MADPEDPKRPTPPSGPGAPLPRLWKHEKSAGPDDPDAPGSKKKKRKAEAASKPAGPATEGKKGALVAGTPEFDTYEARQRVRIVIGVGMLALILLLGWIVAWTFFGGPPSEESLAEGGLPPPPAVGTSREQLEQEARILFNRARELAKGGKANLAVAMLKRVSASYSGTTAALEAKEALERPAQNLPLFLDRPAVVASPGAPEPAPVSPGPATAAPKAVVEASPTAVPSAKGAQANLTLPSNPAEPIATPAPDRPPPPSLAPSRPLPKGFYARPGTKVHESGWPFEIVGERDGAPMVLIPGGTFLQGRDGADAAEAPLHRVHLATYYLDQHEVTVRQFSLFQKEAGRRSERVRALARDPALVAIDADESKPVVMVSARDAADYAAWSAKRLPTEAQWEAAGRTPDGRVFPWGNDTETLRDPKRIGPVMAFKKDLTPYGAFDLAGNAQEWTKDWFETRYYQLYRNTLAENPTGPASRPRSQQLVVKGVGSDWVLSRREGIKVDTRLPYLGFRCVLPVEGPGNVFEPPTAPPAPGQPAAPGAGGSVVPF